MKPVMQTVFGEGKGNCFAACLASILELPIEAVPNFMAEHRSDWFGALNRWLAGTGLRCVYVKAAHLDDAKIAPFASDVPLIVGGKSPRGLSHAVIWHDGEIVHDPHPEGGGIDRIRRVYILTPISPAVLRRLSEGAKVEETMHHIRSKEAVRG